VFIAASAVYRPCKVKLHFIGKQTAGNDADDVQRVIKSGPKAAAFDVSGNNETLTLFFTDNRYFLTVDEFTAAPNEFIGMNCKERRIHASHFLARGRWKAVKIVFFASAFVCSAA
jgi:hypothetical protein